MDFWRIVLLAAMASAGNSTLLPPPLIVDNTHKHYDVAIICILLGILGTSIVVLRLWYRYKTQAFGADDYAMIPAVVSSSLYIHRKHASSQVCVKSSFTLPGQSWLSM